jgi:hypothetical protein
MLQNGQIMCKLIHQILCHDVSRGQHVQEFQVNVGDCPFGFYRDRSGQLDCTSAGGDVSCSGLAHAVKLDTTHASTGFPCGSYLGAWATSFEMWVPREHRLAAR